MVINEKKSIIKIFLGLKKAEVLYIIKTNHRNDYHNLL